MATYEDLSRFSDFDTSDVNTVPFIDIINSIVETVSGSYVGQYKVKQTLADRLIATSGCCPYCNKELYSISIWGRNHRFEQLEEIDINSIQRGTNTLYYVEQSSSDVTESMAKQFNARMIGLRFDRGTLEERITVKSVNCDHIVPRARGGSDIFSNLIVTCETCNKSKNNLTAEEFGYPDVQALTTDVAQIPIFNRRGTREFATIHLPIEVYESFHAIHGDVSQFVHKEINKFKGES